MSAAFNVLITGIGGQGVLWLSRIIAQAACQHFSFVCRTESRGLSQRGGVVCSAVRFGNSALVPTAGTGSEDLIIALDALEAVRAMPSLKSDGILIGNENFTVPIHLQSLWRNEGDGLSESLLNNRIRDLLESNHNLHTLDLAGLSSRIGCENSNVIMAGAASRFLPIPCSDLQEAVLSAVRPDQRASSEAAFALGRSASSPFISEINSSVVAA